MPRPWNVEGFPIGIENPAPKKNYQPPKCNNLYNPLEKGPFYEESHQIIDCLKDFLFSKLWVEKKKLSTPKKMIFVITILFF